MTRKKIVWIIIISIIIVGVIYLGFFLRDMSQFATGVIEDTKHQETFRLSHTLVNGDIIFQTSKSSQSRAIQLATNSKYSHMGIIYRQGDKIFVFEAVQPVKLTPLDSWITRGADSKYVVKRLINSKTILTSENLSNMRAIGDRFLGKEYDIYFGWSDDKIYCSELVWKIYNEALDIELGNLETLKDFNLKDPIVKEKLHERYGDKIPMDEKVISPASMFDSDKLELVLKN